MLKTVIFGLNTGLFAFLLAKGFCTRANYFSLKIIKSVPRRATTFRANLLSPA